LAAGLLAELRLKKKPVRQSEVIRVWTTVIVRVILILVVAYFAYQFLYEIRTVLLLLVLSVFFCYLIAPLVRLLEQPIWLASHEIKLHRGVAISIVYLALGAALFFALQMIWPILWTQVTELGENLPTYISSALSSINKTANDANSWVRHLKIPREWRESLLSQSGVIADSLLLSLQALVGSTLSFLTYLPWLILVPILSFFLLKDATLFEQSVVSLMPNERLRKRAHWLLMDVSRTLAAYIRAQLTACVVVWVLVTGGLMLLRVPYALVLGTVAGVLEFIPLVGPLIAAVVIVSLAMTSSWKAAVVVAVFLGVLRIVQDYIIYPRIVGYGIKMHPLVVVLAILAGAEIGGLSGVFLSVPIVGMIMVGYNHYLAYKGVQELDIVHATEAGHSIATQEPVAVDASAPEALTAAPEAPVLQK
jgi:predicted PurR-regulated permease PerM